ncbi:MAG TPA: Asd/ArgC dimerization domain-containing protein [Candidatus Acidoferrales bacterium]|jgi:aspartate-semialdehyde dehydrogenase|nr:Asd/ArgC dimerization domain-containing protein [Candidatus Acidoferrales bacterium]
MPSGPGILYRVAIVGASSLLGKELKLVLEDRHFPASDVILLDESVMAGTLTEAAGEPTFIRALEEDSFEGARFVFFAGTPADAERNWRTAQTSGATVIDLTGAVAASASDVAGAVAWIPSLASALAPRSPAAPAPAVYVSPAAPVIVACTLAAGFARIQPQRIVLVLFRPVSDHDQAGVEELESQTASLLSFREIDRSVFDTQVAFNLLARYGEASKPRIEDVRAAIARDVVSYLAGRVPVPAIQLVQAPVFYGYAFAAYADLGAAGSAESLAQLEAALSGLGVKVAAPDDASPTNVSVAGESEIHLARIEPDPGVASGAWVWGVVDNLRLAATNAVRIAEELVAKSLA